MSGPQISLLITLTGRDRPGVTSRLFSALAAHELTVDDIEQVVIRGRLVLGVLLTCRGRPDLTAIHREVAAPSLPISGWKRRSPPAPGSSPAPRPAARHRARQPPPPAAIAAIAGRIAAGGANIDRIGRLAHRPVTCIELDVSGADPDALRAALARGGGPAGVDVAVQRGGLHRRAMRLVVMDVDSTLIQGEVIDLLAGAAGCADEVAKVTAAAMRGELDFATSLQERVALLAGLGEAVLDEVRAGLRLAPGARTLVRTLKRLGYRCGDRQRRVHPVHRPAGGRTRAGLRGGEHAGGRRRQAHRPGRRAGHRPGREGRRAAPVRRARPGVPLSQTVAVGDGANDLDMIAAAGLGIAFNAKPAVRAAADASVSVPYLDAVLYLLGVSRDDVEDADEGDAAVRPSLPPGR